MYQARVAGANFSLASCGHPVRPEEAYLTSTDARQTYCARCGVEHLGDVMTRELAFLLGQLQEEPR